MHVTRQYRDVILAQLPMDADVAITPATPPDVLILLLTADLLLTLSVTT
jgi:hypothetical protein